MSTIVTRAGKGTTLTWAEMDNNLKNLNYGSYISVKDSAYGAVGDGITDDTAAIQSAINASYNKVLLIPSGNTFLSGTLNITSPITIILEGTLKYKDNTGTFINVTSASDFILVGPGKIDLNATQYIGIQISNSTSPIISGDLTISNMLGGASSIGNSSAIVLDTCTRPTVRGVFFTNILHGTAPADSQPRSITLDTCTDADINIDCYAVNTGVVVTSCTGTRIKGSVGGGGVTNDNVFYIIGSTDTIVSVDIRDWTGEPIVADSSTDTIIMGGSQIDCAGNANGFEDCTNLSFIGTVFRGNNVSGILKSRTGNTSSTNIRLIDCTIDVSSTQDIISFFSGIVVDFTMLKNSMFVTHDTGKVFGNKFIRLVNTTRFLIENNTIIFSEIGAAAAADFTIELDCSEYSRFKQNTLVNRTTSGRFRVNGITALVASEDLYRQANVDAARNPNYLLTNAEPGDFYAVGAPVAGTYVQGDRIWNTSVAAGGTPGWICTTAGTPGTWKAMASVAA